MKVTDVTRKSRGCSRRWVGLWLLMLSCALHAQVRFDYFYHEAEKMRLAEDYSSACELYNHCFRINPEAPAVLHSLGVMHHAFGNDSLARVFLTKACEKDSCNVSYLNTLVAFYTKERNTDDVLPLLERLARLNPKNNDVHSMLATLYCSTNQLPKAIDAYNSIERNVGANLALTSAKAEVYCEMGDSAQAYAELEALRRESPHDMNTLVAIAGLYEGMGQTLVAQELYDEVRRRDPLNERLHYALMQHYLNAGQKDRYVAMRDSILFAPATTVESRNMLMRLLISDVERDTLPKQVVWQAFDTLLARPQTDASLFILKAIYQVNSDSTFTDDDLAQTMRQALEVEPNNQLALEHLLQYYGQQSDMPALEEICRRGINYYPETMGYHYYLCIALVQQKKEAEAVEAIAQGLRIRTEDENVRLVSDMFALMGDLQHQLHRESEAFAAYDSALVYNPENVSCLNNYAYYLSLRHEQLDRAEEMSYRTVRAEPKNKTYLDTYAWILFMKEDYTGARRYMEQVVDPVAPEDSLLADEQLTGVVLEHAGDIYAKCGQMDEALYYWNLARQRGGDVSATLRKKIKKKKYLK